MNPAISITSVRSLLECYIRAKDRNQPELIFACFAADAALTFDIATDAIDFPRSVSGASAIAKTLVSDFGERFDRCRTYYMCAAPEVNADGVCTMPWFVVMRQKDNEALRLGKGTYRWRIARMDDGSDRIAGLHIAIERMDGFEDPGADKLRALQALLPYPWLQRSDIHRSMEPLLTMNPDTAFATALTHFV
ncbi:nuclear transport factor 2 family protein [Caballeronia sp. J97]|uniref:nuclear transport factor 2 family protein n=1 Tax=Caballeronia sp. J97 TaxID=2805429 RepID=UPI002AB1C58D|nr:nuclear transport factor 2 family protein [Caballeronia sp. J97]